MRSAFVTWCARVSVLGVGFLAAHCSGETTGSSPTSTSDAGADQATPTPGDRPTVHRPTAVACDATRAAVKPGNGGVTDAGLPNTCSVDADCTAGKNGRCVSSRTTMCNYDECFTDDDCEAGSVCHCGATNAASGYRPGHQCVKGDCRIDADCGATGFCSPTLSPSCGAYGGVSGYYCHTAKDTCLNDSACVAQGKLFCGWQPTTSSWACSTAGCVG